MHLFWDVLRCEFRMSVRRKGMWLAFGLIFAFYVASAAMVAVPMRMPANLLTTDNLWKIAAQLAFGINLFTPVIAGISAA